MGLDEIARLVSHLQTTPWYYTACVFAIAYIIIVLYKLARSEEGFIVGYRGWALGKWQKSAAFVRLRADFERLKANVRLKTEVIILSRQLDADIAYLLAGGAIRRSRMDKIRAALISGVARVVVPSVPHRAGLFVPGSSGEHLILYCMAGYTQEAQDHLRVPVAGTVTGRCFRTGEAITCQDVANDPLCPKAATQRPLYRSVLCMPVRAGRMLYGVLAVEAEPSGAFSGDDVLYLEQFAAKLAVLEALSQRSRKGGGKREGTSRSQRDG